MNTERNNDLLKLIERLHGLTGASEDLKARLLEEAHVCFMRSFDYQDIDRNKYRRVLDAFCVAREKIINAMSSIDQAVDTINDIYSFAAAETLPSEFARSILTKGRELP
jgi:hypothetical protein